MGRAASAGRQWTLLCTEHVLARCTLAACTAGEKDLSVLLCRYEFQGEYVVPANVPLPTSAADLTVPRQAAAEGLPGRWRLAVAVPSAELQEIVPAARLLRSASSLAPADYERAKLAFIAAISHAEVASGQLDAQIRQLLDRPSGSAAAAAPCTPQPGMVLGEVAVPADGPPGSDYAGMPLLGLQDVRGQWSGSVQAYGSGTGAGSVEFNVRGANWSWGSRWGLDSVAANGAFHSEEGVQLQEVSPAGQFSFCTHGEGRPAAALAPSRVPVRVTTPHYCSGYRWCSSRAMPSCSCVARC